MVNLNDTVLSLNKAAKGKPLAALSTINSILKERHRLCTYSAGNILSHTDIAVSNGVCAIPDARSLSKIFSCKSAILNQIRLLYLMPSFPAPWSTTPLGEKIRQHYSCSKVFFAYLSVTQAALRFIRANLRGFSQSRTMSLTLMHRRRLNLSANT